MSVPLVLALDEPAWAAFVESQAEATPFHHPAWARLLVECYGFRGFAFVLREGNEIVAGVPVVEVRSPTRKRRWVALPFTDVLAPLGPPGYVAGLVEMLDTERSEEGVGFLEMRAEAPLGSQTVRGLSHVLPLAPRSEDVFATFSRSQVQRNIARAEREGVEVRVAERADDLLETFYRLHLLTRRRQGVPIQPRRFFSLLWERILGQGLGRLYIAELDRNAAAAAVFLEWNGMIVYKFGASDPQAWGSRPNHALFWEAIRRACAEGLSELDFGRTDVGNEGLRAFKASWGTDERELVYTNFGKASEPKTSGRLGTVLAATIRRSPLWVCRFLGERLYRYAG